MILSLIAAVSDNGAIGKDNALPWRIPEDLKRFKTLTLGHTVVMGRRTYESIGKPLPKRRNLVLTSDGSWSAAGVERCASLSDAIETARGAGETELFAIGGERVYREALAAADRLYLTRVRGEFPGDAFFPPFDETRFAALERDEREGDPPFAFVVLERIPV